MNRKKVLQTITINGLRFRWTADWAYLAGRRTVRLRVWGGDKTKQYLYAHLIGTFHGFHAAVARGEIKVPTPVVDQSYVVPREVRALVEYALIRGWDPQASGAPFCLCASDPAPSDDLKLVDIL